MSSVHTKYPGNDDDSGEEWKRAHDDDQRDRYHSPPEDHRLIRRVRRLLGILDRMSHELRYARPVMADDMLGARNVLDSMAMSIESDLMPPPKLQRSIDHEDWADEGGRRMSLRRLRRHCLIVRRAASKLQAAHHATAIADSGEPCRCCTCFHAEMIRWFLSRAVHLTLKMPKERKVPA